MATPRSISVLMPIYNGERFLPRVLEALAAQEIELPWDFLAVDCSSTDSTPEIFEEFRERFPVPLSTFRIEPGEFDHGDTRNLLAGLSSGELLVYLTDDAIPASPKWLATFVSNFEDPRVGGAYCRNEPRPEADLLAKIFCRDDPTYAKGRREVQMPSRRKFARMTPHEKRLLFNYCDSASAMRRELWERHPYPRCRGAEDVLVARGLLQAGYTVVFEDRIPVLHSHEYDAQQTAARARMDGEINAEWLGRLGMETREGAEKAIERHGERDRQALQRAGLSGAELERESERATELRRAHFEGMLEGGRTWKRRRPMKMLDDARLTLLFVIDGRRWSEEETKEPYAVRLARSLQERGHRCAILACHDLPPGYRGEVLVERGERDGLTVWRALAATAGEGRSPGRALRAVIEHESIQLVHFHDRLGLDPTLLGTTECKDRPSVMTCDGSWVELSPDEVAALSRAGRACELAVSSSRPLAEWLRELPGFEADRLIFSPTSGVDGLDRNASLVRWEYRYRELCCQERERRSLLDLAATDALEREGDFVDQGNETMYMRAGGAALEYRLHRSSGGEREILLDVPTFENEGRLLFGGRILVDGGELCRIGPFSACGIDEVRTLRLRAHVPPGAERLCIENRIEETRDADEPPILRLRRIAVRRPDEEEPVAGEILLDRHGLEADAKLGQVAAQGIDAAVLGPEPSALEYDLSGVGAGAREVEVHVFVEGHETQLLLGGRILVDELVLGRFGPFLGRGSDEVRVLRCPIHIPTPPRTLRIENVMREGLPPVHLRVKHVLVRVPEGRLAAVTYRARRVFTLLRARLGRPAKLGSRGANS